jgi:hypothetical protein
VSVAGKPTAGASGNGTPLIIFGAFYDLVSEKYGSSISRTDVDTGTQICGPREYLMDGDWDPLWGKTSTI